MSILRRKFCGAPVERLISSVPTAEVKRIREVITWRNHPARRSISEFVRLAIAEKLQRDEARGRFGF
jgi:hypothetical protein